jgi:hypothetical protein
MSMHNFWRGAAPFTALAIAVWLSATASVWAGERLPVVMVSDSPAFDRACVNYYRQGNDPDVARDAVAQFCRCLGAEYGNAGLGEDALEFFARTLSEDLTTFIDEYPEGNAWMQQSFAAEKQCKNADYGENQPPPGNDFPVEAGSWGGVVRTGAGREFSRLTSLAEGERITILENTGVMDNDYPWFKIRYRGNRQGYQWGGIICSLDAQIDGTFETCP